MDLQQIGLQHPRVRQLRHVINNTASSRHRHFVAEGVWAHSVLLEQDAAVEAFLWCPEASHSDQAQHLARACATRAAHAYRISPRVLERLAERDQPDGLVSLVALPEWSL